VAGFAAWTVLANAVVLCGGTLYVLLSLAAAALALRFVLRRRFTASGPRDDGVATPALPVGAEPARGLRIGIGVAAIVLVAHHSATGDLRTLWIGAVALLAVVSGWELARGSAEPSSPLPVAAGEPGAREQAALWALAAVCALLPLFLHRSSMDDAYYLSLAVAAADDPRAALLAGDPLHGVSGVPLALPVYKVHALELLDAAIAHITPLRVLDVAHVLIPLVAGLLVPLAYARLLRLLVPGRWLWATAAAIVLLLFVGDALRGYGNFAFVLIHEGKAILLAAGIPLLVAFALEFAALPTLRRWLRLLAVQIAAIGLSSTALWLAPATVGLAIASATRPTARGLRTLLLGVASSGYVLAWGLALRRSMLVAFWSDWNISETNAWTHATSALSVVLGDGAPLALWLLILIGGWSLASTRAHRMLASLFTLGFLLLLWNPYTANLVAAHVAGYPTYSRVFWLLPLPALAAAALTWPLEGIRPRIAGAALAAAAVAGFSLWAPSQPTWHARNRGRVGAPGWKVPDAEMRAARLVASYASPGAAVLAPFDVSPWITTLHHHPHPLVVRRSYLSLLRGYTTIRERRQRLQLALLVSGIGSLDDAGRQLAWGIRRFSLEAVCLISTLPPSPAEEIRKALLIVSFEPVGNVPGYEVWARRER
jgi:hypothetical protein